MQGRQERMKKPREGKERGCVCEQRWSNTEQLVEQAPRWHNQRKVDGTKHALPPVRLYLLDTMRVP